MMPGIAHATDDSSGMNDLPLSPHRLIRRSIRNAARAMYPQSSSTARNANRIRICGRNLITPPTPVTMPSFSSARNGPGLIRASTLSPIRAVPSSIRSMSGSAPT